jgi:phospholipid transport system substrate-binding protein
MILQIRNPKSEIRNKFKASEGSKRRWRGNLGFSILLVLVAVGARLCACADEPTAQIRTSTDKILALLRDPALNTDARNSERRQLLRKELDQRVDWATVARSSLGRHWTKRTPAERAEFTALFSRLLVETALDRFETNHVQLDKIEYLGEKIIDDCASVKVQVTTKDQVVHPVEYRLQKSGEDWRIYDVLLEGVSLVKNYRDQFDEILAKYSYEKLLADLRAKTPQGSP